MNKLLIASLVAVLALTACKKQEQAPAEPTKTEQAEHRHADEHKDDSHEHKDGEHKDGEHSHGHAHGTEHGAGEHAHHHHEGDSYKCDNDKTVIVAVHDHEGEIEAHATIDDVEYDLHPDSDKKDVFISHEDGINDKGMTMTLAGDKATFADLDGKALLNCQKSGA